MPRSELRRLDLNLLLVLDTVLRTGNVTAAARKLNMSQPAVSRAVGRLRVVFSDPLFVKGARGVVATPRAQSLALAVRAMLSDLDEMIGAPEFDPATAARVFRIASTDYGALSVLSPLAEALSKQAPGLRVDVVPLTLESFSMLTRGEVDLALYSDDPVPEAHRSLPLFEENYSTMVRAGHPALLRSAAGRIDMQDFLAASHILVNVFGGMSGVVDDALADRGLARRVGVALPYFAGGVLMAATSDMILTAPSRVAHRLAAVHGMQVLDPPLPIDGFGYRAMWHPRNDADPGMLWLVEQLRQISPFL